MAGPESLFNSYVNMDQLGADEDQRTGEDALPGGDDDVEDRTMEDGVTNGQASPMHERTSTSDSRDRPSAAGNRGGAVCMQHLEEGELDPNDVPRRRQGTPEEGKIFGQESRKKVQKENQPQPPSQSVVGRLAPTSSLPQAPSSGPRSVSPPFVHVDQERVAAPRTCEDIGHAGYLIVQGGTVQTTS